MEKLAHTGRSSESPTKSLGAAAEQFPGNQNKTELEGTDTNQQSLKGSSSILPKHETNTSTPGPSSLHSMSNNSMATDSISEHIVIESSQSDVTHLNSELERDSNKETSLKSSKKPNRAIPENKLIAHSDNSWSLDVSKLDDVHISNESSIQTPHDSTECSNLLECKDSMPKSPSPATATNNEESQESITYSDSLIDIIPKDKVVLQEEKKSVIKDSSSSSEEIIKLDIRGKAQHTFPPKYIFGPPPHVGVFPTLGSLSNVPIFPQLIASSFGLLNRDRTDKNTQDNVAISEIINNTLEEDPETINEDIFSKLEIHEQQGIEMFYDSINEALVKSEEKDCLKEELTVTNTKDNLGDAAQARSLNPELETGSFTTDTDYRTLCDDYQQQLVHFEEAVFRRDEQISELKQTLQKSLQQGEELQSRNQHLEQELGTLQQISHDHNDILKDQLSDFVKYENMTKVEDSTKYFSVIHSTDNLSQNGSLNSEKDVDREEIIIDRSKDQLDRLEDIDSNNSLTSILKEFVETFSNTEFEKCSEELKMRIMHSNDVKYSVQDMNVKHNKEMEDLRKYFEKKCRDIGKNYSEEFSQHSGRRSSATSSGDSGDDFPKPLLPASPLRSSNFHTKTDLSDPLEECESRLAALRKDCSQKLEQLKKEHLSYVSELQKRHSVMEQSYTDEIRRLKADLQTVQNTDHYASADTLYPEDTDLELEKGVQVGCLEDILHEANKKLLAEVQEQLQALLSDPDADLTASPLDLIALRAKIHTEAQQKLQDMKIIHEEELSSLRAEHEQQLARVAEEGGAGDSAVLDAGGDVWRRRRNDSFDKNRHLQDITKERDGLKQKSNTLQKFVTSLVNYFAVCEEELNSTVLDELVRQVGADNLTLDITGTNSPEEFDSKNSSFNNSTEMIMRQQTDVNCYSRQRQLSGTKNKRVHFAPNVRAFLSQLEEQDQLDLSAKFDNELELSQKRLRQEAEELLALCMRVSSVGNSHSAGNRRSLDPATNMETEETIKKLVEDIDSSRRDCDKARLDRKTLENTLAESIQSEAMLKRELHEARDVIARLLSEDELKDRGEVVTEGYGLGPSPRSGAASSLPPPCRVSHKPTPPSPESRSASLDGSGAEERRAEHARQEVEALTRDRDDLNLQLEAAKRKLRSIQGFLEQQTTEREHERDDFESRITELRDENERLCLRAKQNEEIMTQVELLEMNMKEMTNQITNLESTKSKYEEDLKSAAEKVRDLRDIIGDLESQLETKLQSEARLIREYEEMQNQFEVKDVRIKRLLEELELLKTEQESRVEEAEEERKKNADASGIKEVQVLTQMREQLTTLEDSISKRTVTLERIHESICSQSCSSPSEDISIRDYKRRDLSECVAGTQLFPSGCDVSASAEKERHPALLPLASLARLQDHLQHHFRAEDAALKRIRDLEMQLTQLKDVAQELRAERDVLQERMSEQALKISSLQSRLEQQRHCADALRQESTGQLNLRLQDALTELRDANDLVLAKDKQILRLKALQEGNKERLDRTIDDSSPGRDRICKLEQELADARDRNLELCRLAEELAAAEADRDADLQLLKRQLIEKEEQMQGMLALKLDEENLKDQENYNEGAKNSARTLSDIVSFSDYDEHDLQMRRAEVQPLGANLSAANANLLHYSHDIEKTLPPHQRDGKLEMSSLQIEHCSPPVDRNTQSLPFFTTPDATDNVFAKYKRNINETIMFGSSVGKIDLHDSIKHSTAHAINDNSMYPNQEVTDDKNVSVEPKRINFSASDNTEESLKEKSKALEASKVKSLKELGFVIDINNENYPDTITQLKCEIVALRRELNEKKETLTSAEQQLVEFPKVKIEMEELKNMLQSTVQTVEQDKLFYNEQLENLSGSKRNLEQQLADVLSQANEKTNDLQLLKEDILRRENMVLELVKEKRNVQAQLSELDIKYQALENRNQTLESYEEVNVQLREKLEELRKLEQLVSEKNLQIDSLYEHLDRLDDLQRCLSDKNDEIERLNYSIEDKLRQISTLEEEISTLREGTDNLKDDNDALKSDNEKLSQDLTKLQKEQENLLKKNQHLELNLQEMEKTTSLNEELVGKLEEVKILRDQLKDKQYEIDILNEDMQSFHEEIASLEDQLKASRSPSPRVAARSSEDRMLPGERRTVDYKKELVKIRKQVSMLQAELKYNKKELNEKVFELERIKLEVMELKNDLGRSKQTLTDKEQGMAQMQRDKEQLTQQLHEVRERLGEESQLEELRCKLHNKTQECHELQQEMLLLQDVIERLRSSSPPRSGRLAIMAPDYDSPVRRSPTRDLEERVRRELQYSRQLDDSICDQILSAAEDDASHEDVPPLILQVSQSNSSMHSSLTDKLSRMSDDNEKLRSHASSLEARLQDKEALVEELQRARDAAERDSRQAQLLAQDERDNALQLKILLDKEKHNTDSLQVNDRNVIQILSRRLESAIESEAEVHRKLESERRASVQLQRQLDMLQAAAGTQPTSPVQKENVEMLKMEVENQLAAKERLRSELMLLKAKYEREKCLTSDLMSNLEKEKRWFQTEIESRDATCCNLRADLADLRRARHDAGLELARALDTLHLQRNDIAALEKRLAGLTETNRAVGDNKPFQSVLAEFEQQKLEMIKEICALKKSLDVAGQREANLHRLLRATDQHGQLGQHNHPTHRNQMMDRIRQLEAQLHARNSVEDNERAARFLHARCMGLESHRKALVFQKQYLLKMLHGYNELDLKYRELDQTNRQGKRRFKCVVWAVCASLRLRFLVRRRHTTKKYSADQLFNRHKSSRSQKRDQRMSASEESGAAPNSPPSRDAPPGPTKGSSVSLYIRTGSVCDQLTNTSSTSSLRRGDAT